MVATRTPFQAIRQNMGKPKAVKIRSDVATGRYTNQVPLPKRWTRRDPVQESGPSHVVGVPNS